MLKTKEQQRAHETWNTLVHHFGPELSQNGTKAKKYLTAMRQTATRVHVSGLGQALAFLRSRGDAADKAAANDLAKLALEMMGKQLQPDLDPSLQLIRLLRESDVLSLVQASEEVMALIAWFSRYLQGAGIEPGDDVDIAPDYEEGNEPGDEKEGVEVDG